MDMSMGGCSNQSILHNYIKNISKIKPNDILIFGWTQPIRFRIASKRNDFYDVIIAVAPHMKEFIDMSIDTLNDITINRSTHSIFWDELNDYITVINESSKNSLIFGSLISCDFSSPLSKLINPSVSDNSRESFLL